MRSSWLASATNRRIRSSECRAASSERRALASEAALAPKADSIWASMVLRARPSRPTSVRGSRSGTRRVRSPAAIALAVCSMSTSGRRLARTMAAPTPARATSTTSADDQVDQPELAGGAVDPVQAGGHDHAAPGAVAPWLHGDPPAAVAPGGGHGQRLRRSWPRTRRRRPAPGATGRSPRAGPCTSRSSWPSASAVLDQVGAGRPTAAGPGPRTGAARRPSAGPPTAAGRRGGRPGSRRARPRWPARSGPGPRRPGRARPR